jgi:alginate O-acetyltransferase complex protein AlgI
MALTSVLFLAFICLALFFYYLAPKRLQWVVLLVASYIFYIYSAGKWTIFLFLTTVTTYYSGILLGKLKDQTEQVITKQDPPLSDEELLAITQQNKRHKKIILTSTLLINFGILALLKYPNFLLSNLRPLLDPLRINPSSQALSLILPIGISFYTFQAAGYVIDVYRGVVKPDKHFGKFALFLSFFPQIVQGPISRHNEIASQLSGPHEFNYTRAKFGIQLMLWGYFKKMVIADRIIVAVNTVFGKYEDQAGVILVIGALLYSFQVYCDFSGGIDIARGVAQIFGINLPENFKQPLFATSIADFWRRWHISLSFWMRDYIFYPLSISKNFYRMGKITRRLFGNYTGKRLPTMAAMLITFIVVGIWHGASWKFVAYGLYNAFFIIIGMYFGPLLSGFFVKHKVNTTNPGWRFIQIVLTFIIVGFGRFFSRAVSFRAAIEMMRSTVTN